jgi:hypothetical protein
MSGIFDQLVGKPGEAVLNCQQPSGGGDYYNLKLSGDLAYIQALRGRPDWVPISSAIAYNRGLIQYLKKVGQVNQAFSGQIFLGELRETLRMIKSPAQGIRNILGSYFDDLKRQKKRRPKQWKKNLSGSWLEYAFGIVPLVSDIQDACKAWNRLVEEPRFVLVTSAGVEERNVPSRTLVQGMSSYLGAYAPRIDHTLVSTDRAVVRFKGYVKRESRATLAGKAQLFGFDPIQFVPTVWELIPWSFLIDYFTNIGDIIETGCVNRSSIAWTNVSTVVFQIMDHNIQVSPAAYQMGSDRSVGGTPSTAKYTRRYVERSTPSELGLPSLTLELPGRPTQWANMTALFAQVSNGLHPQRMHTRH